MILLKIQPAFFTFIELSKLKLKGIFVRKICLSLLLLFFIPVPNVQPQTSTARFLYWQPSALSTAMGGTGVSFVNNPFAAYYNPASFAFNTTFTLASSYVRPFPAFENTQHSFTSIAYPFQKVGTFGIAFNCIWKEPQLYMGESGQELGLQSETPKLFEPNHWQVKISYASLIHRNIALGINLNLLNSTHVSDYVQVGAEKGSNKTTNFFVDFGILIDEILPRTTYKSVKKKLPEWIDNRVYSGFSFGLSILNLGQDMILIDKAQEDKPPTFILCGLSYWPVFTDLFGTRLAFELEKRLYDSDEIDYIHAGGELLFSRVFMFRSGYFLDTSGTENSFFTYGFGFKLKFLSFNVARYTQFLMPTWHFSGQFRWEF